MATVTMEIPSVGDFYDVGKTAMQEADVNGVLRDSSFAPGSMFDLHLEGSAVIAQEVMTTALELYFRTFLGKADGDDLTVLAKDHWNLDRQEAAKAVAPVTFSRAASSPSFEIPSGTLVASGSIQFQTTAAVILSGTSVAASVEAVDGGSNGNVDASTITTILSELTGTGVSVTNSERAAGGADAESDAALRKRVRAWAETLRRGTQPAIKAAALNYPGIVNAGTDETTDPATLFIADVDGGANSALVAAMQEYLLEWRALGVAVNVQGASLVNTAITIALTFTSGTDTISASDQVKKAIEAFAATLDVNDTLYISSIIAAAKSIDGVADCSVSVPAGNVVPSAGEVFRIPATGITLS